MPHCVLRRVLVAPGAWHLAGPWLPAERAAARRTAWTWRGAHPRPGRPGFCLSSPSQPRPRPRQVPLSFIYNTGSTQWTPASPPIEGWKCVTDASGARTCQTLDGAARTGRNLRHCRRGYAAICARALGRPRSRLHPCPPRRRPHADAHLLGGAGGLVCDPGHVPVLAHLLRESPYGIAPRPARAAPPARGGAPGACTLPRRARGAHGCPAPSTPPCSARRAARRSSSTGCSRTRSRSTAWPSR